MAIFHLSAKIISRGKGQSAIAAAAYRSGDRLRDELTGEQKYYPSHEDRIVFTDIMAPSSAPEWAHDRNRLWNTAEQAEKRKDAQLAREIEVSLPHELTERQREWLVKDFAREAFVRKGYAVDIAIHAPYEESDERNHHAHLMVTRRTLGPEGFSATKDWQFDKKQLGTWREQWAHLVNRHLERHGHEERIDHRSLKEQGVKREPTIHLGYAANEIDRRGAQSDRMDELRGIMARNEIRVNVKAIEDELRKLERAQAKEQRQHATRAAKTVAPEPALSFEFTDVRDVLAKQAERERQAAVQQLQRADRADQRTASNSPAAQAFSEGARVEAQKVRQERRDAYQAFQQTAWRQDVAAHAPKPARPRQAGTGLNVVNGATGVVSSLGDFLVGLLAGPSPSQQPRADMAAFVSDPAARKEQQLARLNYARSLEADQKARERMGEDMRAGRNLRTEDIERLTHEHQMQIRARGDDAVREMVDEARRRSDSRGKDEGRELDR